MAETISLAFTDSQWDDLLRLCDLNDADLNRIETAVAEHSSFRSPSDLGIILAAEVGADIASSLQRAIVNLAVLRRRTFSSVQSLLESVTDALHGHGVAPEQSARWPRYRQTLEKLLNSRFVQLVSKATEHSYDFDRLLTDFRILTDIRPLFDEAREQIISVTVTQTLKIETITATGIRESMSMALENIDIQQLLESGRLALQKADVTKRLIETKLGIVATLPGDDGYAET